MTMELTEDMRATILRFYNYGWERRVISEMVNFYFQTSYTVPEFISLCENDPILHDMIDVSTAQRMDLE